MLQMDLHLIFSLVTELNLDFSYICSRFEPKYKRMIYKFNEHRKIRGVGFFEVQFYEDRIEIHFSNASINAKKIFILKDNHTYRKLCLEISAFFIEDCLIEIIKFNKIPKLLRRRALKLEDIIKLHTLITFLGPAVESKLRLESFIFKSKVQKGRFTKENTLFFKWGGSNRKVKDELFFQFNDSIYDRQLVNFDPATQCFSKVIELYIERFERFTNED